MSSRLLPTACAACRPHPDSRMLRPTADLPPALAGRRSPLHLNGLGSAHPVPPEKAERGRSPCQTPLLARSLTFLPLFLKANFATILQPARWPSADQPPAPIAYVCLTLVLLSAVVSANPRLEFKREV